MSDIQHDHNAVLTTPNLEVSYFANENLPMLNQYIRRNLIGKGKHGKVHLCEEVIQRKANERGGTNLTIDRKLVAMKTLNRQSSVKKLGALSNLPRTPHTPFADRLGTTEAMIRKEIAVMKKLRHPHVLRLLEVIDDRLKSKVYLVMEYCAGGEVKWRRQINGWNVPTLTTYQTRRIMRDVILGLEYLHFQGIIHRDIKPQNLLWNADRSVVKICDFGVSHFSSAQRMAAAGAQGVNADEDDPVLLDDSDLAKRAGTPNFLAPEVVYEHTYSFELHQLKPPITKAVDIWSLGCTLYCLLFADLPFRADGASEYQIYNLICNDDYPIPMFAGCDHVATGGRHPTNEATEGYQLVHLLDHMLDKDMHTRITLPEIKKSPWLMRDVVSPKQWLRDTSPNKIEVTPAETETAMTDVRFRWRWGAHLTRHISTLFRTVRPSRSRGGDEPNGSSLGGSTSAAPTTTPQPGAGGSTTVPRLPRTSRSGAKGRSTKRPSGSTSKKLAVDVGQRCRSADPLSQGTSTSTVPTYVASDANVPRLASGSTSASTSAGPSSQGSPTDERSGTGVATPSGAASRSRFSLIATWNWRPGSSRSGAPTPTASSPSVVGTGAHSPASRSGGAGTSTLNSPATPSSPVPSGLDPPVASGSGSGSAAGGGGLVGSRNNSWLSRGLNTGTVRRSEEALRVQGSIGLGASLTAARRASSFGDNRVEAEVLSVNSDDDHEHTPTPHVNGHAADDHPRSNGTGSSRPSFRIGGSSSPFRRRDGGWDIQNGHVAGGDEDSDSDGDESGPGQGGGAIRSTGSHFTVGSPTDTDWDTHLEERSVLDGASSLNSTLKGGNYVSDDNLNELLARPNDETNPYGLHYQHRIAELERERRLKDEQDAKRAQREEEKRQQHEARMAAYAAQAQQEGEEQAQAQGSTTTQEQQPPVASGSGTRHDSDDEEDLENDELHQDDIGTATHEGSLEDDVDFYHDESDDEHEPLSFDTTRRKRSD
ncbi:hypothetical protein HGRIS_004386 [Hohenbuehelia grisea]|uniref:Protein kinase domain-containing protein n=1 Tax=Hohenbuehelia grisea TaxID=104357 RepID=A0ABR3JCC3_9AGAR